MSGESRRRRSFSGALASTQALEAGFVMVGSLFHLHFLCTVGSRHNERGPSHVYRFLKFIVMGANIWMVMSALSFH